LGDFFRRIITRLPRAWRIITLNGVIALIIVIGASVTAYRYVVSNLAAVSLDPTAEAVNIKISSGATTVQIAQTLAQAKLIRNQEIFRWYASYKKYDGTFRRGEYTLSPAMDVSRIMAALRVGPVPVRITIPEGYSTKQITELLAEKGLVDKEKFFKAVRDYDFKYNFLQGVPATDLRLEGFLFPDTYDIEKGTPEEKIIGMMLGRFSQELTPAVLNYINQKGWSPLQFVTLASLIEKEAEKQADSPVISQVFQRRLKLGMPLQSNTSIDFILGYPKPELTLKDLAIKSPYNTYIYKGLPPGPIANPGHASLQAAASPAPSDYLYFFAKPDGYHVFAKTYQEHLQNIKKYGR